MTFCMLVLAAISPGLASGQTSPDAQFFDSGVVPIRYVRIGDGEPVVLVHGFGGRLEFWQENGIAAALAEAGFAVVAYDGRGHGQSGKPYDPAHYIGEEVQDVMRLLDHLSIDRAHVVGYSRGANIASRFTTRYPGRVRSVVFGGWGVANPVATLTREDCLVTSDLLARTEYPLPLMRALGPPGAPSPTVDEQAALVRQFAAGNDMRALAAAFRADCNARPTTSTDLRQSGTPALAIVGEHDGMAPSVRTMGDDMGGAMEVVVIEGANHFTAPGHPQFVARLVSFLRAAAEREH
jgi:pimeloyl-ACP methyl ester carboxylesterase